MNGAKPGNLEQGKTLTEQNIENESILVLDIKPRAQYFLKIQITENETIQLPYNFNDNVEKIKADLSAQIQVPVGQMDI